MHIVASRLPAPRHGSVAFAACVGALITGGLALPASAQVIDQYLDPNIPGYGAAAGVTVASRAHPEYDPAGIRVGLFTLRPTLDESVGYDDNVTGTRQAQGSLLIDTQARLEAASQMSDGSLDASVSVDDSEYPQQSSQSFTNWTAALGASHAFGRDTLYIGATHLNLNQTPRDLDVPQLNRTIGYRVDDLRASYDLDLGRIKIDPAMDVSWFTFDNGSVGGQSYVQSYRDRIVYAPSISASYEFATRRRLVLIFRDADAQYANPVPGVLRQDFNDISALGGVSYDVDGIIGFRLLAGYEERSFASRAYRMIQAPIVEGSVSWTPTGLTTITGTAARYIEDSASEATIGYTETALRLNVDHELFRNIVLNANAGVFLDDYAQGGGSQSFYTGGVGATWLLDRRFRLAADYTFSSRQTSGQSAINPLTPVASIFGGIFGQSYSENVFRLRLRIAL